MDDKSLELLEFPHVREILAGFTSFSASHDLATNLIPLSDYEQISRLLKQSAEARYLLSVHPEISIGGVTDIRQSVKMAALGKVLEPQSLVEIQSTLVAIRQLRNHIQPLAKELPMLWDIAGGIIELRQLEADIAGCIAPTCEILDSASPELSAIRRQLKVTHQQLIDCLQTIVKSPQASELVDEPAISEREGRYVIPVQARYKKQVRGIVHGISNTGFTVFVEPLATVEMGNALHELAIEEKHEIDRILTRLSAEAGVYATEISHSIELVAEIDLALAKARYARRARATEPAITAFGSGDSKGVLKLIEARHPLLGEKAVPLSLEIGKDFSILVITGPNTGGKTVALKTIGLLSMMAQAGMPVPAAPESHLPVFDSIFADIGDEQSIEQTLSTFSWHIGNLVRIINRATRKSLVLMDELGTSTDPAEGSALARAILLYLLSRGIMAATTTHFGDLKAFAYATPGFQNASLDFNPVTLAPTYHLTLGIPGGSNALVTAARLGLPLEIVDEARKMLPSGTQELENLLTSLITEKQNVENLRAELETQVQKASWESNELEKEVKRVKDNEKKVIQAARDRVVQEVAELHREIREALANLKREKSREKVEQARKALASAQQGLRSEVWQTQDNAEPVDDELRVGDVVQIKETSVQATVLSIREGTSQVELQAGQAKFTLNIDNVEKLTSPSVTSPANFAPNRSYYVGRAVPLELDLRGKRADEVESAVDAYLNDAALSNLGQVRIIHGIGTGTVRQIVRDYLPTHPLVKSFRPGERNEGGDGVTMVKL